MSMNQRRIGMRAARLTVALAVAASGLVVATSQVATAAIGCSTRTTTRPFKAWGDNNAYFVAPGGTFESSVGWTGSSLSRAAGNEPWKINGSGHGYSLKIGARGQAKSAQFCVNSDEDSMRLFFKSPGVSGASLKLHIEVISGVNRATNDYDINGSTAGWALMQRIMLPDIRDASGQQYVSITLTAQGTSATWYVDDVMIDPWKSL